MLHSSFLNFHGLPKKSSSRKPAQTRSNKELKQSSTPDVSKNYYQPNAEEMRWVFDKFDANKDGKISRQEYKSALRAIGKEIADAEIAKEFQAIDTDGDGSIDFKEFIEVMQNDPSDGVRKSDIESAFRVFDLDGSGKISAEELMVVLKRMGERASLDACRKMIRGVDGDGDGLIDMDEFMSMMTRTMKLC